MPKCLKQRKKNAKKIKTKNQIQKTSKKNLINLNALMFKTN